MSVCDSTFAMFRAEIRSNIARTVDKLRPQCGGMSAANLFQVTPTPKTGIGPTGTNAPFIYRQMFNECLREMGPSVQSFIIKERAQ